MNVSSTKTAILILQYTTNNRSTIPFILVLSIYLLENTYECFFDKDSYFNLAVHN